MSYFGVDANNKGLEIAEFQPLELTNGRQIRSLEYSYYEIGSSNGCGVLLLDNTRTHVCGSATGSPQQEIVGASWHYIGDPSPNVGHWIRVYHMFDWKKGTISIKYEWKDSNNIWQTNSKTITMNTSTNIETIAFRNHNKSPARETGRMHLLNANGESTDAVQSFKDLVIRGASYPRSTNTLSSTASLSLFNYPSQSYIDFSGANLRNELDVVRLNNYQLLLTKPLIIHFQTDGSEGALIEAHGPNSAPLEVYRGTSVRVDMAGGEVIAFEGGPTYELTFIAHDWKPQMTGRITPDHVRAQWDSAVRAIGGDIKNADAWRYWRYIPQNVIDKITHYVITGDYGGYLYKVRTYDMTSLYTTQQYTIFYWSQPIAYYNSTIFACERDANTLHKFDSRDMSELNFVGTRNKPRAIHVHVFHDGTELVYCGGKSGYIEVYDTKLNFISEKSGFSTIASLQVANDILYVGDDPYVWKFAISSDGSMTEQQKYNFSAEVRGTCLDTRGNLHICHTNNDVAKFDNADLSQSPSLTFSKPSNFVTQIVIDKDDILYAGSDDDNIYAIDTKDYILKWQKNINGNGHSVQIGIDGYLYATNNDVDGNHRLFKMNKDTGKIVDTFTLSSPGSGIVYVIE